MSFKLYFFDWTKRALSFSDDSDLAHARYATCADNSELDFGTNDFAIEFMGYWDSTIANPGNPKFIVAKNLTWGLANEAGWQIYITPNSGTLSLRLNDGSATQVASDWAGVWTSNTITFFRFELDRNVGTTLYKNGVKVSTLTEITGRTGSVNNSSALLIGGLTAINNAFKGSIYLLRFDTGYLKIMDNTGSMFNYYNTIDYGEVWNYEAYLKVKHFWPEKLWHYRAAWYFQNSLVDLSADAFTFAFKDGNNSAATATYTDDIYSPSYVNTFDPLMGSHEWGPIDLNDKKRGLDGTMRIYKGADKLHKGFAFRTTDVEMVYGLLGSWYNNAPLQVYENSTTQPFTMRAYLSSPPVIKELIRRGADTLAGLYRIWDISIDLEEM